MDNIVELRNLGIEIDVKSFSEDYKEKNMAFFALLDNAVEDNTIKVYRAIEEENDYYNLIVIEHNNIYNAFPEPLIIEYISIEDLKNKIFMEEIERKEMDDIMRSQRETSYAYLKNKEDKAKLILKLIQLTSGKLTKEEIEDIVNNTEGGFEIKIITDAKEFVKELILYNREMSHSWAGSEYTEEKVEKVWWKDEVFKPGKDYSYEYYDNGNLTNHEEAYEEPNFDTQKKYAIIKSYENNDHYNGNCFDCFERTLIIYLPDNNPYKIDDSIQYVLNNFNI